MNKTTISLAVCISVCIIILAAAVTAEVVSTSPPKIVVEMQPFVSHNITILERNADNVNAIREFEGSFGEYQELLDNEASPLYNSTQVFVSLRRLKDFKGEQDFEQFFVYKGNESVEISILPGRYEVEMQAMLFENISILPDTREYCDADLISSTAQAGVTSGIAVWAASLPAVTAALGPYSFIVGPLLGKLLSGVFGECGFMKNPKTYTVPGANIKPFPIGGAEFTWQITEEELYSRNASNFYVIVFPPIQTFEGLSDTYNSAIAASKDNVDMVWPRPR